MAYQSKLKLLRQGIVRNNSFWDRLVFDKIRLRLGGRVKGRRRRFLDHACVALASQARLRGSVRPHVAGRRPPPSSSCSLDHRGRPDRPRGHGFSPHRLWLPGVGRLRTVGGLRGDLDHHALRLYGQPCRPARRKVRDLAPGARGARPWAHPGRLTRGRRVRWFVFLATKLGTLAAHAASS